MNEISNAHWQEIKVWRGFDEIRDVYAILDGRGYIAGSYAAYMASVSKHFHPNDIDIFAVSNEESTALVTELQADLGYYIVSQNDVAYSLNKPQYLPIQIVRPSPEWQSFPDDILNSFDMNVCRGALITPTMLLGDVDLGHDNGKLLRMHNPLRTLKRVMKYSARGVQFNDHELLKLFRAWSEMDDARKETMLNAAYADAFPAVSSDYDYQDWHEDDSAWFEGE